MITHEIIKVKPLVQVHTPAWSAHQKREPNIKNQQELNEFLNGKPFVGQFIRFKTNEKISAAAISCIVYVETDFDKLRDDTWDGFMETHFVITKVGYSNKFSDAWERWVNILDYVVLTDEEIKEHIDDNLSNYFKEAVGGYKTGEKKPRPQRSQVSRKAF